MLAPNPHHRPSRHRNANLAEKFDTELLDSVGNLDAADAPPEHLNPLRSGREASSYERGRFEHARRYNSGLTWGEWQELTRRLPPGRRPKSPTPSPAEARASAPSPAAAGESAPRG